MSEKRDSSSPPEKHILEERIRQSINIDDLLEKTGLPCSKKQYLNNSLVAALCFFEIGNSLPTKHQELQRLDNANKTIEKTTRTLLCSIQSVYYSIPLHQSILAKQGVSVDDIEATNRVLFSLWEGVLKRHLDDKKTNTFLTENVTENYPNKRHNAVRHLIIEDLKTIYETAFERDWGYSKPSRGGEPYGPFIRFSEQILGIAGEQRKPAAIASIIDQYKNKTVS